jgi:WhiB family redox-sensing transcriptional regulator
MTTNPAPEVEFGRPAPRGLKVRAQVRLFHTNRDLPCLKDPELFFDPTRKRLALNQCATCVFRGRCGYNAVATGATFGIWGGINLPGDIPARLEPVYDRLAEQFEQRRHIELGDAPVAPLPGREPNRAPPNPTSVNADDDSPRRLATQSWPGAAARIA